MRRPRGGEAEERRRRRQRRWEMAGRPAMQSLSAVWECFPDESRRSQKPILHERNRAVTFLKRKNGLFKKAYELGVLCSVDVAVIIFEERPGHHVKLYQYCSTDIQDMVQRHIRYEGEKDTRGPADFSGNATKQMDDIGDGDDDDADDDDNESGVRGTHKRRGDGRLKPVPPMGMSSGELVYPRITMPTQPPMSMPGLQQPGTSSSLPISRDREIMHAGTPTLHPAGQNKRQRVDPPGHSRSSSDDPSGPGGGSGPYFHPPGSSSSSYRQQTYHTGSVGHQYGNYFPVGSQTSPHSSFIPLQAEYPGRGTSSPAQTGSGGPPGGGGGGGGHYGTPTRQQYDPSLYSPSIIRHQQQHTTGPGGNEMYPVFQLETDGQRQAAAATPNQSFGMDWPVHGSNSAAPSAAAPSGPASSVSTASSAAPSSAGGESNWLDFLSGNNPNANAGAGGGAASMSGEPPRSSMSWERGHEVSEIFSGPGVTSSGGGGDGGRPVSGRGGTSPLSNKRSRGIEQGHGEADDSSTQGG
ncbi:hypothetical protein AX15_000518 [Amanita polypyramis BW_CC]|nr:hypothetical protein AX15_000518 [Amanita polypyramis BW_CC]